MKDYEKMIGVRQVMYLLGVDRVTLYRWREKKFGPPAYIIGPKCVRYKLGEVVEFRDGQATHKAA